MLLLLHHFSTTTSLSQYQRGKASLDLNEARDDGVWGWKWHQLDHTQIIFTSLQTDNHTQHPVSQFLQAAWSSYTAQPTVWKHWRHRNHLSSKFQQIVFACSLRPSLDFYRAMLCIRGTSHGLVSVSVCVCLSQVGVLLKRLNVGSQKQHHTIAQGL